MAKKRNTITTLILFISFIAGFSLQSYTSPRRHAVHDSLLRELTAAKNAQDSLMLSWHLYDITSGEENNKLGWQIYELASRLGDTQACMDVLRQLSVHAVSDSAEMIYIERMLDKLPRNDAWKESSVFIRIYRLIMMSKNSTDGNSMQILAKIMNQIEHDEKDELYLNIMQLNTLLVYMGNVTSGELYVEYLDRLEKQIRKLPSDQYALKNMYYTRAAITYTAKRETRKAIDAELELLRIIDGLKEKYAAMGRRFRDYSTNYYISYRRILSNYTGLSDKEVEDYYRRIVELEKENEELRKESEDDSRPLMYYLMAKKRYAEAVPHILKQLKKPHLPITYQVPLLAMLKEAAKETGNTQLLIRALTDYNNMLEQYNRENSAQVFRELQVRYDIHNLKVQNIELKLQKKESEVSSKQKFIHFMWGMLAVVLILLGYISWLLIRSRRLASRLFRFTEILKKGRQHLQRTQAELLCAQKDLTVAYERAEHANRAKSEFLHSMSHEVRTPLNAILGFSQLIVKKIPDDVRPQLEKFARIVAVNTEYLSTLINDILDISSIESGEMLCDVESYSVHTMASVAVDNIKGRSKPGVSMAFVPSGPDFNIRTDKVRVQQVLINLLNNAAKYTEAGTITLEYYADMENKTLTFSVTDTGPGIPAGKEEEIFERFVKLDSFSQGTGLGLYISRSIAKMLGGRIYVDTLYKNGARFCFTIPMA